MCRRDSGSKQKEQFDVEDKFNFNKQQRAKTVALKDTTTNSNERSIEFRSDYRSFEVSV